ncbi:DNA polymerase III subunit beta [Arcanobacterium hippocoleae]|uniref:DNA polymerase III subunit beta n=1 Tax=Arcanobacterium hippocoleae TaxID=149017 RepID=UPI003341CB4D
MKIQVMRDVFTEAVSWVAKTIPSRPAMPVLAGLKLRASQEGTISLISRDSDITSHVDIEAAVDEPGEVLVNGRLLAEVCRNLPNKPINLELDGTQVELECGSARFTLKTMSMDDYSEIPPLPPVIGTVDGNEWQEAVSQVTVAASNDETLPMLVSVCLEIDGAEISLMATDRYRLALREINWKPADEKIQQRILVRASRLLDIAKSLGTVGTIEISLDNLENPSLIGFSGGGKQNTVQLIDGEYPQVRTLFPTEVTGYAVVDRQLMADAIKRSKVVVEKNSSVRLSFTEGELVIEAGQGDMAQASEALPAELNGEDISLAFNPNFLSDGLSTMNAQNFRFSYTQPAKPAVISPENDQGEVDESFKILLMPVRTFGGR